MTFHYLLHCNSFKLLIVDSTYVLQCNSRDGLLVFFQSQVLEFMWDIFSFNSVRYTSVEVLATDIMDLARRRAAVATSHMSSQAA